ncbi:MAG TPA: SDR family oxidoreductase [Limnobacter sp.]|nr:SDR family oxidoreductase [Limnobacter sp.]
MKNFKNKVVVVTGAASGMGRAYALMFAREGSHLALCDYAAEGLEQTIAMVKAQHPNTRMFHQVLDVSSKQAVYTFATQSKAALGNACIVINNAGVSGEGAPVWAMGDASYERVMGINFWGVVYGTRAFLPQLIEAKEGAIVNVSSVFGLVGTPNNSDYCASKFAVRGFTESLAVELNRSNIQVHLVHPGGINTNIASQAKHEKFARKFLTTPPEDIVEVVRKCIVSNEPRIVYGNNAARIWWGARFVPFKALRKVLWQQMGPTLDPAPYKDVL